MSKVKLLKSGIWHSNVVEWHCWYLKLHPLQGSMEAIQNSYTEQCFLRNVNYVILSLLTTQKLIISCTVMLHQQSSVYQINFLVSYNIFIINWPSASPDMNLIKNLWSIMKHQIRECYFDANPDALFQVLTIIWNKKTC